MRHQNKYVWMFCTVWKCDAKHLILIFVYHKYAGKTINNVIALGTEWYKTVSWPGRNIYGLKVLTFPIIGRCGKKLIFHPADKDTNTHSEYSYRGSLNHMHSFNSSLNSNNHLTFLRPNYCFKKAIFPRPWICHGSPTLIAICTPTHTHWRKHHCRPIICSSEKRERERLREREREAVKRSFSRCFAVGCIMQALVRVTGVCFNSCYNVADVFLP